MLRQLRLVRCYSTTDPTHQTLYAFPNEFRRNPINGVWVAFAPTRGSRPTQWLHPPFENRHTDFDANCPFCPGNEHMTEKITLVYNKSDKDRIAKKKKKDSDKQDHHSKDPKNWALRVVENKYPVVQTPEMTLQELFSSFSSDRLIDERAIEIQHAAIGYHEVVIESPIHNLRLGYSTATEAELLFNAFAARGRIMAQDKHVRQLLFFKNQGRNAGASLAHPHAQLVALPVVPNNVRTKQFFTQRYFMEYKRCVMCTVLEKELKSGVRVIAENGLFVAFVPFAAITSYQIYIVPKNHYSNYIFSTAEDISALASIVTKVMKNFNSQLDEADYNMIIRTAPVRDLPDQFSDHFPKAGKSYGAPSVSDYFHWYLEIIPRLDPGIMAGFEYGSGMFSNHTLPEDDAARLRHPNKTRVPSYVDDTSSDDEQR